MNAEILCVGTEILLGDIVNTNAAYLSRRLAELGIGCYYQTVAGDNPGRLEECLRLAFSRADMVITTGGLGPTYDDLTKETVAAFFGREMELHQPSLDLLKTLFERFGRPMTPNNEKQAYMPKGAVVFHNDRGTANGLALEGELDLPGCGGRKIAILLPGPPREMTAMYESGVRPYLEKLSSAAFVSRTIHLFGIGESQVEQDLRDYMQSHENPTIAPYAKEGEVQLRVTASAASREEAAALTQPVVEEICSRYPPYIYGVDAGDLQTALVRELTAKGRTLATAESCTGGLVSKRITEVSGASAVFGCGLCTYSNEMKTALLKVSPRTLERYGAVSPQTAREMAAGVRALSGADIGVSVTGIAGPEGGTPEKPVGLVYVGVDSAALSDVLELRLSRGYGGEREYIRYLASSHALHLALQAARQE